MSKCETIAMSTVAPTLVFSGCGLIVLQTSGTGAVYFGGSDVNTTDKGAALPANTQLRIGSDDELYAIATEPFPGSQAYVKVLSVR